MVVYRVHHNVAHSRNRCCYGDDEEEHEQDAIDAIHQEAGLAAFHLQMHMFLSLLKTLRA